MIRLNSLESYCDFDITVSFVCVCLITGGALRLPLCTLAVALGLAPLPSLAVRIGQQVPPLGESRLVVPRRVLMHHKLAVLVDAQLHARELCFSLLVAVRGVEALQSVKQLHFVHVGQQLGLEHATLTSIEAQTQQLAANLKRVLNVDVHMERQAVLVGRAIGNPGVFVLCGIGVLRAVRAKSGKMLASLCRALASTVHGMHQRAVIGGPTASAYTLALCHLCLHSVEVFG